LANDLMEYIICEPFNTVIDNWDGWTDTPGQVMRLGGEPFLGAFSDSNYADFRREVSCAYVYVPQESGAVAPKYIRVTIRVYYGEKEIAVISRLISE